MGIKISLGMIFIPLKVKNKIQNWTLQLNLKLFFNGDDFIKYNLYLHLLYTQDVIY